MRRNMAATPKDVLSCVLRWSARRCRTETLAACRACTVSGGSFSAAPTPVTNNGPSDVQRPPRFFLPRIAPSAGRPPPLG